MYDNPALTRRRDTSTSKLHFAPPVIYYLFRTSSYSFLGCKGHVFLLVPLPELHVNDVRNGSMKFKYKQSYQYLKFI
jgi:hypothetical protein